MNHKTRAIVIDAWWPQVNGVVITLMQTRAALTGFGYQVTMLTPQDYATLPCPGHPEIRLDLRPSRKLNVRLDELRPDHIHIATDGPLGLADRACCLRKALAALKLDRGRCRAEALKHTWSESSRQFSDNLVPAV
jgi:hypothetical protein